MTTERLVCRRRPLLRCFQGPLHIRPFRDTFAALGISTHSDPDTGFSWCPSVGSVSSRINTHDCFSKSACSRWSAGPKWIGKPLAEVNRDFCAIFLTAFRYAIHPLLHDHVTATGRFILASSRSAICIDSFLSNSVMVFTIGFFVSIL